ncbi:MAG: hypothetical protein QOE08_1446, partial [Thermoleophilaceae bacterium]|nr:hypothetical protein [Thermoleophilaceae bacterium]
MTSTNTPQIIIRPARTDDGYALSRLAALDSSAAPTGRILLAEVDGELVAALPVDGGRPIADPFRATTALVALLELRAAQIAKATRPERRGLRVRARRALAHAS